MCGETFVLAIWYLEGREGGGAERGWEGGGTVAELGGGGGLHPRYSISDSLEDIFIPTTE